MLNKEFFQNMSRQRAAYVGCASLALGMFMFGIGNALIKEASETLPTIEVVFLRSAFSVGFMVLFLALSGNLGWLKSHNVKLQSMRGLIGFFGLTTLFWSFDNLPLPEATVFTFASTLVITALSAPILKEKVGLPRWIAILVGFAGVLIIARPSGNVTLVASTVAVVSATIEALVMLMARLLKKDKPITSVFYHTGIIALIALISLLFFPQFGTWKSPDMHNLIVTSSLGFVSCLGHISIVYAYSIAPAVVVAPMLYTLIIWGALFGYIFWGEVPSTMLIVGAPLIIGSGIYIMHREKVTGTEHTPEIIE